MFKNNLSEISEFSKKNNNSISDFNLVNNLLLNLNFTKYRFNNNNSILKKQSGGAEIAVDPAVQQQEAVLERAVLDQSILQKKEMEEKKALDELLKQQIPQEVLQNIQDTQTQTLPVPQLPESVQTGQIAQMVEQLQPGQLQPGQLQPGQIGQIGQTNPNQRTVKNCSVQYITNPDGSVVEQEKCDEKLVTFPDMYLPRPDFINQEYTYTIKKGTILYHAVENKRGFNTNNIQLGNDKVVLFFTPNFRLASDKIEGCSVNKQKGYIHVFEVKQDIPNIFIKLPYDTNDDVSPESLHNQFCSNGKYFGVGFFYPKNEIELFSNIYMNSQVQVQQTISGDNFYSEFGLCNPTPFLTYLYSQICESIRKLSQPYRFD